ncbi:MAG: hypothetical protein COA49_05790 [Bacteroidetes bacterium]|nr:MAG: hypothetical protein COA49_05790 [Bacteroidota bacterium]
MKNLIVLMAILIPLVSFSQSNTDGQILRKCEIMPAFGECVDAPMEDIYRCSSMALMEYVGAETKYPETALVSKTEGTIYLVFVVETDGSVNDVKVMRGIGDSEGAKALEEEALRVVKGLPNFRPGTEKGEAVRIEYILPVKFLL